MPSVHKNSKIMKRKAIFTNTQINIKKTEQGESIEEMLRRLTTNKQAIPENVPPIYTPKDEGVLPDYDIRTDRFDVAYNATDKFSASEQAKSAAKPIETTNEEETE